MCYQKVASRTDSIGDLVVEIDSTQPIGCWKLAVVEQIHPSDDSKVRKVTITLLGHFDNLMFLKPAKALFYHEKEPSW
jgi:hypothetical protein